MQLTDKHLVLESATALPEVNQKRDEDDTDRGDDRDAYLHLPRQHRARTPRWSFVVRDHTSSVVTTRRQSIHTFTDIDLAWD